MATKNASKRGSPKKGGGSKANNPWPPFETVDLDKELRIAQLNREAQRYTAIAAGCTLGAAIFATVAVVLPYIIHLAH